MIGTSSALVMNDPGEEDKHSFKHAFLKNRVWEVLRSRLLSVRI